MTGESVLIVTKHRFLGDTIVATPLMDAVKRTLPASRLTILTGGPAATVLRRHPALDRIIALDAGTGERSARGSWKLTGNLLRVARELRRTDRPDIALIPDRSLRAAVMAWATGARLRIGFDTEGRGAWLTHRVAYDEGRREVECDLDLWRTLHPDVAAFQNPRLFVTDDERAAGAARLDGLARPLVCLQPGASHDYKAWALERWAALGQRLAARGAGLLVFGGPDEKAVAEALAALLPGARNLTGATGLRESMGVLAGVDLFVAADTGLGHIAAAVGAPTVSLFGPTPIEKWRNVGPKNTALCADDRTMASLPIETVAAAAQALL